MCCSAGPAATDITPLSPSQRYSRRLPAAYAVSLASSDFAGFAAASGSDATACLAPLLLLLDLHARLHPLLAGDHITRLVRVVHGVEWLFAMPLSGISAAITISHFFMVFLHQCGLLCEVARHPAATAATISLCDITNPKTRSAPNLA